MRILNIGSGPVTPGNLPGIEIINADHNGYDTIELQNMENLTYPDDSFDLVVCVNALDHTRNPVAALEEMVRVAKYWVYVDCALIQRTTSGGHHFWDALEDGSFVKTDAVESFNIKDFGFKVQFIDNGGERRYNHVVCSYTK